MAQAPAPQIADNLLRTLIGRLDFDRDKAAIKGLTQSGDRRLAPSRAPLRGPAPAGSRSSFISFYFLTGLWPFAGAGGGISTRPALTSAAT